MPPEIEKLQKTIEAITGVTDAVVDKEYVSELSEDHFSLLPYGDLPLGALRRTHGGLADEVIITVNFGISRDLAGLQALELISWCVRDAARGGEPIQVRSLALPPIGEQFGTTLRFVIEYFYVDPEQDIAKLITKVGELADQFGIIQNMMPQPSPLKKFLPWRAKQTGTEPSHEEEKSSDRRRGAWLMLGGVVSYSGYTRLPGSWAEGSGLLAIGIFLVACAIICKQSTLAFIQRIIVAAISFSLACHFAAKLYQDVINGRYGALANLPTRSNWDLTVLIGMILALIGISAAMPFKPSKKGNNRS